MSDIGGAPGREALRESTARSRIESLEAPAKGVDAEHQALDLECMEPWQEER